MSRKSIAPFAFRTRCPPSRGYTGRACAVAARADDAAQSLNDLAMNTAATTAAIGGSANVTATSAAMGSC